MIILGSQSPYKRAQFQQLGYSFKAQSPLYDEEAFKNDDRATEALALELARGKAQSLEGAHPDALILGADQMVSFEGRRFDKPGGHEKALETLKTLNGKTHSLLTAVCIRYQGETYEHCEVAQLKMKTLSEAWIESYLKKDTPYDCAESYKIESYGISLMESIQVGDFTSIQGLPLLFLSSQLKELLGSPTFS